MCFKCVCIIIVDASSVARLGGFPPNWATFVYVRREKIHWAGEYNLGCFCPHLASF